MERDQLQRLEQLELQQQGLFALMHGELADSLAMTAEQRRQMMDVMQDMERQVRSLVQEAQSEGNASQLSSKMTKLRSEHERKLQAVLSDAQKERWKELSGKPLDLTD